MLRVVEVHRTADGGWELVEGAPKPLHTVDTSGGAAAAAAVAAAAPTFRPPAALFAECLEQDSQMNAVFQVASAGTEPLSQDGAVVAPLEISPPLAAPTAAAAGDQETRVPLARHISAAAASPLAPALRQQQSQGREQPEGQGQLMEERAGSETQPDMPACGLLRQLSQVPATPSDPQEQVEETEEGEPAGMDLQAGAADGAPALAAAAAAATPPLVTPASHAQQQPADPPEHFQHAALPTPQQLQFVPETAAELLPAPQQLLRHGAGALPCVPETAADVVPPQFVPETAAELLVAAPLPPSAVLQQQQQPPQFVPETAAELPPSELPLMPETLAELRTAPAAVLQPPQRQQHQHFVPETAAELSDVPADMAPLPQQQGLQASAAAGHPEPAQQAEQPAFVPETAVDLAPLRYLFVTATASPADVLPATAADELAALGPQGRHAAPGNMLPLAVPPPGQPPAAVPGAVAPPPPRLDLPQPQASMEQPQALPVPQQQLVQQYRQQRQLAAGGGLQDFDIEVEAPAAGAAHGGGAASPGGASGFDYDAGPTQPSPEPAPRPQPRWAGPAACQQPQPHQGASWAPQPAGYQQQWGNPPGQPAGTFRPRQAQMAAQPCHPAPRPVPPQQQQWRPPPPPQQQWQQQRPASAPRPQQWQHGPGPVGPFPAQLPYQQHPAGPGRPLQGQGPPMPPPRFGPRPMQQPQHAGPPQAPQPRAQPPPNVPAGPLQSAAVQVRPPAALAAGSGAPSSAAPSAAASTAQQQAQQAGAAELPRKRVSLLDRPQGTFKPVRPLASKASSAAPAGAVTPIQPTKRPAAAAGESGEAKRRRIQAFQAELASILEVDPDRPAVPGGPAGGSSLGGFGSAAAAARMPEDKEARKARISAELEAELFGDRGRGSTAGGRTSAGGRGGGGGRDGIAPGRGGGAPTPQASWRLPLPHQPQHMHQAQQQWQNQQRGPLRMQQGQQGRQQQQQDQQGWRPPRAPAQQQHHHQQARPAPAQQQQQQQSAQPQPQPDAPQHDEGDVMADVAPGAFVTAGRKQAWHVGTGVLFHQQPFGVLAISPPGLDQPTPAPSGQERLAALMQVLQGDVEEGAGPAAPASGAALTDDQQGLQPEQQLPLQLPPPSMQQQEQQQQQLDAHQRLDEGDVMADVAPGAFVSAGRKQAWRIGTGDQGRLAALMRDLQADIEEGAEPAAAVAAPAGGGAALTDAEPPQQHHVEQAPATAEPGQPAGAPAAAAGGAGEAAAAPVFLPATAVAEPELRLLLPATAVADLAEHGRFNLAGSQQQGAEQAAAAQQAAILSATAPAELELEAPDSGSLGLSAEPMSLETARQLAEAEAAALIDRQRQQDGLQQPPLVQQQLESAAVGSAAPADAASPAQAPLSGSKRTREEEAQAQPPGASPPAKQQRQDEGSPTQAARAAEAEAEAEAAVPAVGGPDAMETEPAAAAQEQQTEQEQQQQAHQSVAAAAAEPQQFDMPFFTTGHGGSVTISAAKLQAAQALFGGAAASAGEEGAVEEEQHEAAPQHAQQTAQQPAAGQVQMPIFSTGRGGGVTISAAKLQAAQALFGSAANSTGEQQGGAPQQAQQPEQQPAGGQVQMPVFSTGRGGSVTISAAKLQAAQALFGGGSGSGGGTENEDANEGQQAEQAAGGDSTPLLRKQLLRSRVAEEGSGADSPAAAAAAGPSRSAATPAGSAAGGSGTTPASAPLLGRGKAAGLSRFAPAATSGQLKKKGRRPFVTPVAAGGSGRKFKPPSMATPGGAGASRLGGSGSSAAAPKPAVQLHDLQGSLLKRLLVAHLAAAQGAEADAGAARAAAGPAAGEAPEAAAAPAAAGAAVQRGGAAEGASGTAAQLPLDSLRCSEALVPDVPPPADSPAAAAANAGGAAAEQQQQQQQQQVAAAAPALLGWPELRQRLLAAGANPLYATEGWAKNHFRWVVWKLARLHLLLVGSGDGGGNGSSSSSSGSSSGGAPALLTAAVVLDELRCRYEREFNRGHRLLLKAVLQHDEVASAAMVLMVASVHLPLPGAAPGGGGGDSGGATAAATLELTDGWYWIRASCDERLTQLARAGRISQGDKLRICGGELTSPGPGDPLEAACTAVLRISANNAHPVPAGAKLGRLRRRSVFVPLSLANEAGGPLPQTLVVVHRVFPRLVFSAYPGGTSNVQTPRQYEAMLANQEGMQQRLAAEAATEVQRRELQQCRQWLQHGKRGGMSQFDRIYAQHVVQQAGEGGGSSEEGGILAQLSEADRRGMQRYLEQRQGQLLAQQEAWLQERRQEVVCMPERTQELLQIQVGEVCHASLLDARPGGRPAWRPAVATVTMWGCAEELAAELKEGAIFKVTHLVPQKHKGRAGLALKGTSSTRWTLYAPNAAALPADLLCQPQPRQHLRLASLTGAPLGTSFDYTGQLLGLSRPLQGRTSQLDWLEPSDVGSIFTIKDLALEGADQAARLWHAGGTECSAMQRHKPATLAAAAAARSRAAAAAGRGSGGGASGGAASAADPAAAAEVAAWAGANAGLVKELRGRIQEVLR
ncbi:hypothetical protein ABPG75_004011 [Micractinium tetrahymenae]